MFLHAHFVYINILFVDFIIMAVAVVYVFVVLVLLEMRPNGILFTIRLPYLCIIIAIKHR